MCFVCCRKDSLPQCLQWDYHSASLFYIGLHHSLISAIPSDINELLHAFLTSRLPASVSENVFLHFIEDNKHSHANFC